MTNLTNAELQDNTLVHWFAGSQVSSGSSHPSGTFVRATIGTYIDKDGNIQTAAAGEMRDNHYISGSRTLLLERESTNRVLNSTDMESWTGPGLVSNDEITIGDLSLALFTQVSGSAWQYVALVVEDLDDIKQVAVLFYVAQHPESPKAANLTSRVIVSTEGQDAAYKIWWPNGAGGPPMVTMNDDAYGRVDSIRAMAKGVFEIRGTAYMSGTSAGANINPLYGNETWSGSLYFGGFQIEANPSGSSLIQTTGTAVTRNKDYYQLQTPKLPRVFTFYTKFVELMAQGRSNPRVLQFGNFDTALSKVWLARATSGRYFVAHYPAQNQITNFNINSIITMNAQLTDIIELMGTRYEDGSVTLWGRKNGGPTITTGSVSINQPGFDNEHVTNAVNLGTQWNVDPDSWGFSNDNGNASFHSLLVMEGSGYDMEELSLYAQSPVITWEDGTDAGPGYFVVSQLNIPSVTSDMTQVAASAVVLGTGKTITQVYRTDYISQLVITAIRMKDSSNAMRLKKHLMNGGLIYVKMRDKEQNVYEVIMAPNTMPILSMGKPEMQEYVLTLSVKNMADEPIKAVYRND